MTILSALPRYGLGDLTDSITSSSTIEELQRTVNDISAANGCPLVTYHMIHADGLPKPLASHFSSYPDDWVSHYVDRGLFFKDPVVARASSSVVPFAWHHLAAGGLDDGGRAFFREAAAAGVGDGLSVPVRGPGDFGLFSVCVGNADRENQALITHALPYFTVVGMAVHERARKLYRPKALAGVGVKELSPREQEVMQWVACGKSSWDISQILCLSENRIRKIVASALQKLNCHDRTHAAIRAVLLGIIEPPS